MLSKMDNHADSNGWERAEEEPAPEGVETVEAYEIDGGTVFYDAENPLAWLEATRTIGLHEAL